MTWPAWKEVTAAALLMLSEGSATCARPAPGIKIIEANLQGQLEQAALSPMTTRVELQCHVELDLVASLSSAYVS